MVVRRLLTVGMGVGLISATAWAAEPLRFVLPPEGTAIPVPAEAAADKPLANEPAQLTPLAMPEASPLEAPSARPQSQQEPDDAPVTISDAGEPAPEVEPTIPPPARVLPSTGKTKIVTIVRPSGAPAANEPASLAGTRARQSSRPQASSGIVAPAPASNRSAPAVTVAEENRASKRRLQPTENNSVAADAEPHRAAEDTLLPDNRSTATTSEQNRSRHLLSSKPASSRSSRHGDEGLLDDSAGTLEPVEEARTSSRRREGQSASSRQPAPLGDDELLAQQHEPAIGRAAADDGAPNASNATFRFRVKGESPSEKIAETDRADADATRDSAAVPARQKLAENHRPTGTGFAWPDRSTLADGPAVKFRSTEAHSSGPRSTGPRPVEEPSTQDAAAENAKSRPEALSPGPRGYEAAPMPELSAVTSEPPASRSEIMKQLPLASRLDDLQASPEMPEISRPAKKVAERAWKTPKSPTPETDVVASESSPKMLHRSTGAPRPAVDKSMADKSMAKTGEKQPAKARALAKQNVPAKQNSPSRGAVIDVDSSQQIVRLIFSGAKPPPVGSIIQVQHAGWLRGSQVTTLQVVRTGQGEVLARPTGALEVRHLARGDQAFYRPTPSPTLARKPAPADGNMIR